MQSINAEQITVFIFVFLRVSAIVATMPVVGNRAVPVKVKGGLTLMAAFLLLSAVEYKGPDDMASLMFGMCGEIMIGLIIGFIGKIIFAGIQLAGQLIGFQMGFAIVNVFDPITSSQVSIISQLQNLFAVLLFLTFNCHHIFLYAIARSYSVIPPFGFDFSPSLMDFLVGLSGDVFAVAATTGAPIIVFLLLISVGLGVIARTVPQINVFIVGFPLKVAVGLIALGMMYPLFAKTLESIFGTVDGQLLTIIRLM